ncbi:MAG: Asp-tRNA(Asn)/Glu-tRNA(Gln) amidotransferase subunit GatA [Candidatus Omnitrophica bacterium]|nr:Asp-tRNA(Asn)/Glu-tRNA(Gln) amidotransferase subunit GatA [Candidatus Omnitrophota bacterium]
MWALTAHELADALRQGQVRPREAVEAVLERWQSTNTLLHAYLGVNAEAVRARAERLASQAPQGKLFGVPVAIKDNICVRAEETTCASRILRGFRPPYHATVVERLEAEGAIILGRLNMDEFAFGSSTESSAHGVTRNPWDATRIPGGSSGGSAAAVAADSAFAALGSDTGGSIRQPAAMCGVVGLKPTYGRVSRYGLIAFASSLDQIGPLAKDVTDAALLLEVIAGYDPRDSTSAEVPVPPYRERLTQGLQGLRIGIPRECFVDGLDPEVRRAVEEAIKVLRQLGAACEPTSLPHAEYAVATYYILATAEASSNLARFDGVQYGWRNAAPRGSLLEMYQRTRAEGFGAEAKRRIMLGTYVLSHGYYDAYYARALKVRTLIKQDFDRAFERFDCLVTPTAPTPAFRFGEKLEDPLSMYLSDIYTISVNLAGIPGISVPCGFSKTGLPIGLQVLAAPFQEERLLRAAYAYEQATAWHTRQPEVAETTPSR